MVAYDNSNPLIDLAALPAQVGAHTARVLRRYTSAQAVSATEAFHELASEMEPLSARLSRYLAGRFSVEDDPKAVKKCLREAGAKKGIEFSSAQLSQWFTSDRQEIYLSPQSIFKLCLAMSLSLEESAHFTYDCLYKNWLNCRVLDEAILCFFLGAQELFGAETYRLAGEYLVRYAAEQERGERESTAGAPQDATGYTKMLEREIGGLIDSPYTSSQAALDALDDYLSFNAPLFTGIKRTSLKVYASYLSEGGINYRSLTELYQKATGLTLPQSSYLDMDYLLNYSGAETGGDKGRKRLLWGTMQRKDWLKADKANKDYDFLPEQEIKIERHDVAEFPLRGVPRGNLIALVFFHFCFEQNEALLHEDAREELFNRFYRECNLVLEECGMMPLHPRKHFDRLFLASIALSGNRRPLDYLNELLEKLYSTGL